MMISDITEDLLTPADLLLVREAITSQQKVLNRTNIPAPIIYDVVKSKLTLEIDVNTFKLALSKSVKANKIPGITGNLGKMGGFGPPKPPSKDSNVNTSPSNTAVPVFAPLVIQKTVAPSPEKSNPVVVPITEVSIPKEITPAPLLIEELKAAVEAVPVKTVAPKLAPVISIPSPEDGDRIWNPERAKTFILTFAAAANKDEAGHLRRQADVACLSSAATSAVFRVAMGWDPSKIKNIFQWNDLFDDSKEEKSVEDKTA